MANKDYFVTNLLVLLSYTVTFYEREELASIPCKPVITYVL